MSLAAGCTTGEPPRIEEVIPFTPTDRKWTIGDLAAILTTSRNPRIRVWLNGIPSYHGRKSAIGRYIVKNSGKLVLTDLGYSAIIGLGTNLTTKAQVYATATGTDASRLYLAA